MNQSPEILLASDFSARSDRPLDRAILLAEQLGASLAIAHVLEKKADPVDDRQIGRLRLDLPEQAQSAELVIEQGSAPKVLSEIARARGSDLIVTGVARYNSLGDYLLGTAVEHIIRNVPTPVLVVKRRAFRPYERLLVATDLSDCSRAALLRAMRLFPHAEIALLHAFNIPFEGFLKSDEVRQDVRAQARRELDAFLAHPEIQSGPRERIVDLLEEGEIGDVIIKAVQERGADLLVMGTRGRSSFFHATIGSHAEDLMEIVPCDVLVIREDTAA